MGWRKHRDAMAAGDQAAAALLEDDTLDSEPAADASLDDELLDPAELDPLDADAADSVDDVPQDGDALPGGALLGRFLTITGELRGDEDIEIGGRVEGTISLRGHRLTVGPTGRLHAEVHAREVFVAGLIVGDITAAERVEISATGSVQGQICAPRVVLADGARFRGKIDMGPIPQELGESSEPDLPAAPLQPDDDTVELFGEALTEDARV